MNLDLTDLEKTYFKDQRLHFKLKDGTAILRHYFKRYQESQGEPFEWLPEYAKVGLWLEDNNGKGLLLAGNCGRGKTIIGTILIPFIFHKFHRKIINVYDYKNVCDLYEEARTKKLIVIDELGKEPEVRNLYGNIVSPAEELIDNAEKKNNIIILTTNLGKELLTKRYGTRIVDRMGSLTTSIVFKGESKRKIKQ